jgi:hypothetical protein
VENVLATHTGEHGCVTTEGCDAMYGLITWDGGRFESNEQAVLGSFAYLKPGAKHVPCGNPHQPFVFGNIGWHGWAEGTTVKDTVSYAVGYCAKAFDLRIRNAREGGPKTQASVNNIIGIGGAQYTIASDWSGTNRFWGATLGAVPNPYTGIGGDGPLCFRYVNGVKTNIPLWPWPMDQRIKTAIAISGSSALAGDGTVTGEVQSLLGPIPDKCKR